ncbi:RagB/SusD family nutrient uptake outer membrane protein [Flavobacterium acetivorans]|uniref:RagB/SusD family nutrient uptake outer membrane protein n=1 Tax=Flavobacterium acetivorans TaxID=2893883 RepID=UPI001E63AE4E|nr:RagB/SusD family nutrient uptake outer membrane protein [Flavobacterium sp. F-29]UFH35090.1 RagB/SusD family nutrient uptake outer membrane protein [Flavobacterium sp. F-29]
MKNIIQKSKSHYFVTTAIRFFSICIPLLMLSCDDFVQVDVPSTQLSSPLVFENNSTATAALGAIYAQIRDNGLLTGNPNGMQSKLGEYTDELTFYGAGGQTDASFYNNILLPTNMDVKNWWNTTYQQLYTTNALLEGVENSKSLTAFQKERLRGEGLFIRALLHFHLTNLYGAIPYVKTTDYTANTKISKMGTTKVYENVEVDLLESEALLDVEYISSERIRPNKATVQALLARLYLYSGRWAEAANSASAVLNNSLLYVDDGNLETVFLKNNLGNIWQLLPDTDGRNTLEAETHVFLQGPPPVSALSLDFVNSFEAGDLRRTQWIKEVTNGTNVWYHAYKYKAYNNSQGSLEYSIVFRIAELYLIRAEARAQQGELITALEDLNKIRNKAGLSNTLAVTKEQIISAIVKERKSELFTEGHRFFDLKRNMLLDETLTATKPGWDTNDQLLPLPETELLLNPNLKPQNTGY